MPNVNIKEYNLLWKVCVFFGQVVVPLAYTKFKTANCISRNTFKNKFLHRNLRKKNEIHSMSLIKYNVNSNSWNFFYNVSIINV